MSYTFLSASYGNAEGTAIIAMTEEAGAVALSQADSPEAWAALLARAIPIGDYAPPAMPVPVLISDRQFAQQLAVLGTITEVEALAWAARGDLPAAMEAAIASLPESDRFSARMLLSSATNYERSHPLVPVLGGLLGYDAEAIDDLWRAAAQL